MTVATTLPARQAVRVGDQEATHVDGPRWDDPAGWARREADAVLERGLAPRPSVLLFEGERPTAYVRGRASYRDDPHRDVLYAELFALGELLCPEGVCVAYPVTIRPDDHDGPAIAAAGRPGIAVERVRRRPGADPEHHGCMLPYGLDDTGARSWDEPASLGDGGPLQTTLAAMVTPGENRFEEHVRPAGMVYALTRFGLVVGVDPDWRERYGLDDALDPREVRREDRDRVRAHGRRRVTAGGRP
jgi:hypothetical protein